MSEMVENQGSPSVAEQLSMFPIPKTNMINLWRKLQRVLVYRKKDDALIARPINKSEISRYLMRASIKEYSKYWDNLKGYGQDGTIQKLKDMCWNI
jgi:hypothetical protein